MPSSPAVLNQRSDADLPAGLALATRRRSSGSAGLVGGTVAAIGSPDLLQTVAAGSLATTAGLDKGTTSVAQPAGPSITPLLPPPPWAHPALLLAVLPLLLLLNRRNRATLQKGWSWMLFTSAALLEPLRPRRHVIHDRRYLDQMLEAEFGPDREGGPKRSSRRSASTGTGERGPAGGKTASQRRRSDGERRRGSSDPGSSRGSSRGRQP